MPVRYYEIVGWTGWAKHIAHRTQRREAKKLAEVWFRGGYDRVEVIFILDSLRAPWLLYQCFGLPKDEGVG